MNIIFQLIGIVTNSAKLFGGVFKGKDVISTEDEEFSQVLKLAKELEEALSESLNDLARAAPLGNVHRPILDKIVDIERFRDDLNGQINAVSRDIERSSRENGRMLRLFKKSGEGVTDFGIFRNADSVRTKLLDEQSHLESLADSLKASTESNSAPSFRNSKNEVKKCEYGRHLVIFPIIETASLKRLKKVSFELRMFVKSWRIC